MNIGAKHMLEQAEQTQDGQTRGVNEPNKYYLKGYDALIGQRLGLAGEAGTAPGTVAVTTA